MLSSILNIVNQPRLIVDRLYENVTQLTVLEAMAGYGLGQLITNGWLAWAITITGVISLWGIICSVFRFKKESAMLQRFGYVDQASMAKMTNDDAQKIMVYIMSYEFPLLYKLSLQFAIFKVNTLHLRFAEVQDST